MYTFFKSILLIAIVLFLTACSSAPIVQDENPYNFETRTYYESLDLGTPEAAVKTFVDAYEAGDFFTVYLSMSDQAHFSWWIQYSGIELTGLANTAYEKEITDDILNQPFEHFGYAWTHFVNMMNIARDRGALLFDFGDEVDILGTESVDSTKIFESTWQVHSAVEVRVLARYIPGEVVFTLVQSPAEHWRIHQLSITGGDPDILPWSVPLVDEAIQIPANPTVRRISYIESLNLGSPEAAIETFVDAFHRGDFHTVYLILSPFAQEEWTAHLRRFEYEYLWRSEFNESATIGALKDYEYIDIWYMFDQLMLKAQKHDALLIDLSGRINILRNEEIATIRGSRISSELNKAEITAIAEFVPGEIIFRLVQMPKGDWRVHQVIVSGGNEFIIPWSVPD